MQEYCLSVRVYYEDTDCGGVVYYANYLKFMERARTEWLRNVGYEQDELARNWNIIFVVKSVSIEYQRPAHFNDLLNVTAQVKETTRTSITFNQETSRNSSENQLLTSAEVKIVCLDINTLRPKAIPQELLKNIDHAD